MANLKINDKTEFLYIEENFEKKLVEILNGFTDQKILFVIDTKSQSNVLNLVKITKCKPMFYKKNCEENKVNETLFQFVGKYDIESHLEEITLIVAIGSDDEINIAKQISNEFKKPYIIVVDAQNSSFSYSEFFVNNLTIKKGFLPQGIIVSLKEYNHISWEQKFLIEKAKKQTIKCANFFDELFLGKHHLGGLIENGEEESEVANVHQKAEKFCDIALLMQREMNYHSLFLLSKIYSTLSKSDSLNNEFILYKSLIKIYEIFASNFLLKFKCFKCQDNIKQNNSRISFSAVYIKYILTNFNDLIREELTSYFNEMKAIEDGLNRVSFLNMYNDKQSMRAQDVLKAMKIFSKIQKSPSFFTIIDFYNLF